MHGSYTGCVFLFSLLGVKDWFVEKMYVNQMKSSGFLIVFEVNTIYSIIHSSILHDRFLEGPMENWAM